MTQRLPAFRSAMGDDGNSGVHQQARFDACAAQLCELRSGFFNRLAPFNHSPRVRFAGGCFECGAGNCDHDVFLAWRDERLGESILSYVRHPAELIFVKKRMKSRFAEDESRRWKFAAGCRTREFMGSRSQSVKRADATSSILSQIRWARGICSARRLTQRRLSASSLKSRRCRACDFAVRPVRPRLETAGRIFGARLRAAMHT